MLQAKKSYSANWNIEGKRFLEPAELRRLKRISERLRDKALKDNRKTPVKDWFLITTAIETGLRVQELTDLCCGDIYAIHGHGYVFVRNGKGGKSRPVAVRKEFIEKADEFMSWKQSQGEKTEKDDPLFSSKGRRMSKMALQKSYKRSVTKAGIFQKTGVGIHSLRHTYASLLYQLSGNLRLVQIQLGHASVETTQIYAHVFSKDIQRTVEKLRW